MPNWVKTRLTFLNTSDEEFQKIVDNYTSTGEYGRRVLDFEKIIPMPENIYRGELGPEEREYYGEDNWYDWCRANWGTKWNACYSDICHISRSIEFETAWTFAEPIVKELSTKTGACIMAMYADEDFGYNCDRVTFWPDGTVSRDDVIENSDAAWYLVEELWDVTREELEAE